MTTERALPRIFLVAFAVFASAASVACDRKAPEPTPAPVVTQAPVGLAAPKLTVHAAVDRLVAIGDLHGDLVSTRKALRLAGAIDEKDEWKGGSLVVVQTGDQIDRGDDDRAILDLFDTLRDKAKKAGGDVIAMSGNHEIMNAMADFRYVTPGAFAAFDDSDAKPANEQGRTKAFAPGGPYAKKLAARPVVVAIGDTVFVHGGILPKHVTYGLDRLNGEVAAFFTGTLAAPPKMLVAEDGPVWTRMYSAAPGREECVLLDEALRALGAKRMVVGHTVQRAGISTACDDHVFRIDTGLARYYGGPIEVLALEKGTPRILREPK